MSAEIKISNNAKGGGLTIAVVVVVLIGVALLITYLVKPSIFTRVRKGDTCSPKNKDIRGNYKIGKDKKCTLESCIPGWESDGRRCVKAIVPPRAGAVAPTVGTFYLMTSGTGSVELAAFPYKDEERDVRVSFVAPSSETVFEISNADVDGFFNMFYLTDKSKYNIKYNPIHGGALTMSNSRNDTSFHMIFKRMDNGEYAIAQTDEDGITLWWTYGNDTMLAMSEKWEDIRGLPHGFSFVPVPETYTSV